MNMYTIVIYSVSIGLVVGGLIAFAIVCWVYI